MTRQGLPTGQMEQETQELLDEYNETYNRLVDDYGQGVVDEFIEDFDISTIENFEDMYQGQWDSGGQFAKSICEDCGDIPRNIPSYIESAIDWEKVWDNALSYDYTELLGGHIFNNNY